MARKFMYVCFGLLALTVAFLLGAQFGRAEYVDHSTTGVVAAYVNGAQVLLDDGTVWYYDGSEYRWVHNTVYDLPVPVSTIKFWCLARFVNNANEEWECDQFGWHNEGSPLGGSPTRTQPSTWGSIKAQFK